MQGHEGGGRALRCALAAVGLLSALSAAGTVFLLGQWRELSAALRTLQEEAAAAQRQEGPPSALGHLLEPTAPSDSDPGAAGSRNKRSHRARGRGPAKGHIRAESDDMLMMMTYSMVPVGGALGRPATLRGPPALPCPCSVRSDLLGTKEEEEVVVELLGARSSTAWRARLRHVKITSRGTEAGSKVGNWCREVRAALAGS